MKNLSIIVPVQHNHILRKQLWRCYQQFTHLNVSFHYPTIDLVDVNSIVGIAEMLPEMGALINQVSETQPEVILVAAFGRLFPFMHDEGASIRQVSAGRIAIRLMSYMSQNAFTVIPLQQSHFSFIDSIVAKEGIANYMAAPKALEMNANDLYKEEDIKQILFESAKLAVEECQVDILTIGSITFNYLVVDLQNMLSRHFKRDIKVVYALEMAVLFEMYRLQLECKAQKK